MKLWVDGIPGTWTAGYTAPPPPPRRRCRSHPRHRSGGGSFWASTLALVLVAFAGALLFVGGLLVHFVPRTRHDELRLRIGEFTRSDAPEPSQQPVAVGQNERADKWLSRFAWWPRLQGGGRRRCDRAVARARAVADADGDAYRRDRALAASGHPAGEPSGADHRTGRDDGDCAPARQPTAAFVRRSTSGAPRGDRLRRCARDTASRPRSPRW